MQENDTEPWEETGFVISSGYRMSVLRQLSDGPETPSGLAEASDLHVSHVSRALRRLRDRDLVDLMVPEDTRKGRVYAATDAGRDVWNHVEEEGLA